MTTDASKKVEAAIDNFLTKCILAGIADLEEANTTDNPYLSSTFHTYASFTAETKDKNKTLPFKISTEIKKCLYVMFEEFVLECGRAALSNDDKPADIVTKTDASAEMEVTSFINAFGGCYSSLIGATLRGVSDNNYFSSKINNSLNLVNSGYLKTTLELMFLNFMRAVGFCVANFVVFQQATANIGLLAAIFKTGGMSATTFSALSDYMVIKTKEKKTKTAKPAVAAIITPSEVTLTPPATAEPVNALAEQLSNLIHKT